MCWDNGIWSRLPARRTSPALSQKARRACALSARFYLVAMFFVVFDLEAVFLFAWAVAAREVGWAGYWEVLIFIGVLMAALMYLWRVGALDWATRTATLTITEERDAMVIDKT